MQAIRDKLKIKSTEPDKFTVSYIVYLALLFLPFIVLSFFPSNNGIGFLLIIFYFLPFGFFICVYFLIKLIGHLLNWHWRKAMSLIASPVIVAAPILLLYMLHIPTWVYFQIHKSYYLEKVSQLPNNGSPRKKTFLMDEWGGFGSDEGSESIVYDESDKIAPSSSSDNCTVARKIEGHFYYVSVNYNCLN